jgi:arylsulfatase A-like enzyme
VRQVSRRSFVRATILGSAALTIGLRFSAHSAKATRNQNLLVFLPDELRLDAVAEDGPNTIYAPSLRKLASESIVFDRAYVTHPICSPSRSSILSGTWPHQTRCTNNKAVLPRKFLCLPEMLGDSSYRTGYFGKWHLGDEFLPQHGFHEWTSIEDSFKSAIRGRRHGGQSDYTKFLLSKGYAPDLHNGKCFSLEFPSTLPFELSKPKFLETKACQFLERHRREPFVLFVAFFEPHPPYNGPFNNEYPHDSVALETTVDRTFNDEMPLRYRLRQEYFRNEFAKPEQLREIKQRYFGLISEIDRSIGAILAKVDDLGLRDRTIVALTSDHGDMMSAHGLLGKQLMFEQSAAVPCLVRVPGAMPRRCPQALSHIDFLPTLLDLLDKPPHDQCAGKSRASWVRGETSAAPPVFLQWSPDRDHLFVQGSKLASYSEIQRCLRESTRAIVSPDGWKLCLRNKDKNELYNLRDDLDERRNLYYTGGHQDVIAQLTNEIHRWQRSVADNVKV